MKVPCNNCGAVVHKLDAFQHASYPGCRWCSDKCRKEFVAACTTAAVAGIPLPSVGRTVHYYGALPDPITTDTQRGGPFAALVIDVGPEPTTVTLKVTDRLGNDHVRANVAYGDPGWMWPPRQP